MKKFYDTSSLLLIEDFNESIIISSITLFELEEIKTSPHKTEDLRAAARNILRLLDNKTFTCEIIIFNNAMLKPIEKTGIDINNDAKILATALYYERTYSPRSMKFITNDMAQKAIAALFFDEHNIDSVKVSSDEYTGYIDCYFSEEELMNLYSNL